MSEQAVSKSVHKIPDSFVEIFKEIYNQEISEVEFLRSYKDSEGAWEVFKVNNQFIAYVLNGKCWDVTTIDSEREQKKAFGKRVKYVMEKTDVPWELAKIAVSKNPVASHMAEDRANEFALNFIENLKWALENYQAHRMDRWSLEEELKMSLYDLGHLTKKQIGVIKGYWLSQKA